MPLHGNVINPLADRAHKALLLASVASAREDEMEMNHLLDPAFDKGIVSSHKPVSASVLSSPAW